MDTLRDLRLQSKKTCAEVAQALGDYFFCFIRDSMT